MCVLEGDTPILTMTPGVLKKMLLRVQIVLSYLAIFY
jgi:hypothetical protein